MGKEIEKIHFKFEGLIEDVLDISAIMMKENGWWVIQGLEYDIAAQGETVEKVKESFIRLVIGNVVIDRKDKRTPLSEIGKAPKRYWNKFDKVKKMPLMRRIRHDWTEWNIELCERTSEGDAIYDG